MDKQHKKSQIILNVLFIIMSAIVLFPFLLVVSVSLTDEKCIIANGYSLLPQKFSLAAYKFVFANPASIVNAYKITIIVSVLFTLIGVFLMAGMSYVLANKKIKGRSGMSFFLYFTMLFSGGLVPTYILITKYLHLDDTLWVYIIPGLINPWYVFMMRTSFSQLPTALSEAAKIDGASQYRIFFQISLPLVKPVIATVALFLFLSKWNDWMTAMLYINDSDLISLQYLLQKIMQNIQMLQNESSAAMGLMDFADIPSETVRMAMAVVVAGPALLVFPFFQKYFVKGMTVGSVKG